MKSLSSNSTKAIAVVFAAAVTTAVFGSFETVGYTQSARLHDAAAKAELASKTVKLETIVVTAHRAA